MMPPLDPTPVYLALAALKEAIETSYDPAPQAPLHGVWIYPEDYEHINLTELPVAVVSEVMNEPLELGPKADDTDRDDWKLEILIFLEGGGGMEFPSLRAAAVEATHRRYIYAMKTLLYADRTLGGAIDYLGSVDGGSYQLGRVDRIHWTWDGRTYWGIRFYIPISQFAHYTTGP